MKSLSSLSQLKLQLHKFTFVACRGLEVFLDYSWIILPFFTFNWLCYYTSVCQSSQGGGHRTLLYGHAILLKHTHSSMVSTFTVVPTAAVSHLTLLLVIVICYSSLYTSVLVLLDYFALIDWQIGFWCGLTRGLHRWLWMNWTTYYVPHTQWCRFLYSKSGCLSQVRPAGGPSIQLPSKGLKARRSGWEMTSFLSVFLQNDTW